MEGVLVTGTAQAALAGECARCLEPIDDEIEVSFQELFVYDGPRPPPEEDDEVSRLEDDLLDLEPLLRDAVVLALPFQPLCADDCPGLCPECGARLADDPGPRARRAAIDPRWAALADAGAAPRDDAAAPSRTDERRTPWLSRSGRCRAATRATVARPWKATAPDAGDLRQPRLRRQAPAAPRVRRVRPVRRPRRPSPGPLIRLAACVSTSAERLRDELRAALGDPVLDPELLERALTHRSFAYENGGLPDQRAAGVPRRLGARRRRHRDALPHPPRPLRGPAGQAARRRRQRPRAGRGRPRHRPRRARQARPRRGVDRRPQQGLDPLRHRRGA